MSRIITTLLIAAGLVGCPEHRAIAQTGGAASTPERVQTCGLSVSTQRVPVPPGTPANVAAFHGFWADGRWNDVLCAALMVRSVTPDGRADVSYIHGAHPPWSITAPGEARVSGRITGNQLFLTLANGAAVAYTMSGADVLSATYTLRGRTSIAELRRQ
jgi:hypothetical protein